MQDRIIEAADDNGGDSDLPHREQLETVERTEPHVGNQKIRRLGLQCALPLFECPGQQRFVAAQFQQLLHTHQVALIVVNDQNPERHGDVLL